ncbi:MAG: UPF0410 protein, partial [uncultured Rubrobacteraceae bacterium]
DSGGAYSGRARKVDHAGARPRRHHRYHLDRHRGCLCRRFHRAEPRWPGAYPDRRHLYPGFHPWRRNIVGPLPADNTPDGV